MEIVNLKKVTTDKNVNYFVVIGLTKDKYEEIKEDINKSYSYIDSKVKNEEYITLISKVRAWAKGNKVLNCPPELSVYAMCKEFNCLPDSGGWYDQNPYVCEIFGIISQIVAEEENKKHKKK